MIEIEYTLIIRGVKIDKKLPLTQRARKGTLAFTIVEDGRMKTTIGEYDKEQLESVLLLTLLTMETTIIWLSLKFAQDIKITRKAFF